MKDNSIFIFLMGMFMAVIIILAMSLYVPYSFNKTTCNAIYQKNDNLIIKQCKKYLKTKEVEE